MEKTFEKLSKTNIDNLLKLFKQEWQNSARQMIGSIDTNELMRMQGKCQYLNQMITTLDYLSKNGKKVLDK